MASLCDAAASGEFEGNASPEKLSRKRTALFIHCMRPLMMLTSQLRLKQADTARVLTCSRYMRLVEAAAEVIFARLVTGSVIMSWRGGDSANEATWPSMLC